MLTKDSEILFFQDRTNPIYRTCPKAQLHAFGNSELFQFLYQIVDLSAKSTIVLDTCDRLDVEDVDSDSIATLVNLKQSNDIPEVISFLSTANQKLPMGGILVGSVETLEQRKKRLMVKFPKYVAYLSYLIDFMFKRVIPRLSPTQRLFWFMAADRNRPMSLTETLGRLVYCGFQILEHKEINGLTYYVARKTRAPINNEKPSSGLMIKLKRIGQDGKLISFYKLRTMHPYAEYIQEYVYRKQSIKAGGKFYRDFRVTSWGRFLRKYWIDELPMLINLIKGDLKLVGVRPLSSHYESLYCEDLRIQRRRHKPGLVPPFYADLPSTLEEIMESERQYLLSYEESPLQTDLKYFFKAFYNIVIRRCRSG